MNKFSIDSENNLFRKFIPSNKFQHELEMSQKAYELASTSELFNTPKIKSYDSNKNEIVFELIKEAVTLRTYFINTSKFGTSTDQLLKLKQLFFRIGKAIFLIHSGVEHFDGISKSTFPIDFFKTEFDDDLVYIHGDFTLSNILYRENSDQLFIVDWNTSPIFEFSANFGPRYWDLSFFISSLFYFSFSTLFSFKTRKELTEEFLSGYLKESNLDTEEFLLKLKVFLLSYNYYKLYDSIYESNKSITDKFLIAYTKKRLNNFIDTLPDLFK